MTVPNQTWIALQSLIQEVFQRQLNATAPTAGYHGYIPSQPFQQNASGILGNNADDDDNEESIANTVATQVAALTYQSQLTQSTTANPSQRHDQQMAHIAATQSATHDTLQHVIAQLNALLFNASDAGCSHYIGRGYGGRGRGRNRPQGCSRGHPAYPGGFPMAEVSPQLWPTAVATQVVSLLVHQEASWWSYWWTPLPPIPCTHRRLQPARRVSPGPLGIPPAHTNVQQQQYSNVIKQYSNLNACYLCGFDVTNGHTSMTCPHHLRKATHDIGFNRQNAQQYINLGHPCSIKNRHRMQFPAPM